MVNRELRRTNSPITQGINYLLVGGSVLSLVGVLMDVQKIIQPQSETAFANSEVCQEVVQAESVLSREELSNLLTIPERESREVVREAIAEPYCYLTDIEIRAGVTAQRAAYPLEFEPQTWFVVLYEGDEYAGYSFVFQR
jgi:hypothetical protein